MSQFDESNSPQSENRDQNSVNGTVMSGGVVVQGSGAQVTINQTAVAEREDLSAKEITKKFKLEPETVVIPAGPFPFSMGTKKEDIEGLIKKFGGDENKYKYETPDQEVSLPAYRIGKYPVTNAQYKEFVDIAESEKRQTLITPMMGWDDSLNIPDGKDNFPVTGVTWYQALAYCLWLSGKTGRNYRLPNEAQWEKASRGGKNYLFPWGDEFDATRCNQGNGELAAIDPKDTKKPPQNEEYRVFDLVGNVRQWTCSLWGTNFLTPDAKYVYPSPEAKNAYSCEDERRNNVSANSQIRRVVRGSSFTEERINLRCSIRRGELPDEWVAGIGFRVVMIIE